MNDAQLQAKLTELLALGLLDVTSSFSRSRENGAVEPRGELSKPGANGGD